MENEKPPGGAPFLDDVDSLKSDQDSGPVNFRYYGGSIDIFWVVRKIRELLKKGSKS